MRILVTGATGYVGSRLITVLLGAGHQVVAATRNPARLKQFCWPRHVTGVAMDAGDEASVRTAFSDSGPIDGPIDSPIDGPIDVVYYLVHGIGQPGFRDADNRAAANVAAAARDANVNRIVYLGGFVPDAEILSEHLTSRAEVADSLSIAGGAELVWLGAAMIIGSGSTSFEILRYVGDRFVLIPLPDWVDNPIDPISIRDVLYYLLAAADSEWVPAGAYDICGPQTTSYRKLVGAYARASGAWRAGLPVRGVDRAVMSRLTAAALPLPAGLAVELVASLDHPMVAADQRLRDHVPDPPGGLTTVDEAIALALSSRRPSPVGWLADPHHLADTDPAWAGGDAVRIRRLAGGLPRIARPALGLLDVIPGPVAAALRIGLDTLTRLTPTRLTPKVSPT